MDELLDSLQAISWSTCRTWLSLLACGCCSKSMWCGRYIYYHLNEVYKLSFCGWNGAVRMSVVLWKVCSLLSTFLARGKGGTAYSSSCKRTHPLQLLWGLERGHKHQSCSKKIHCWANHNFHRRLTCPDVEPTVEMIWLYLMRQSANTLEFPLTNWEISWASVLSIVESIPRPWPDMIRLWHCLRTQ